MSEHEEHGEHIVPPGVYAAIIITLLILTGVTVFAAFIDLGRFNIVVALFFMHAKYVPRRTKLVIMAGIFWLALLLFMTLSDYISRVDYRNIRYPMTHYFGQSFERRSLS